MKEINVKIQILNNAVGKPEYSSLQASGLDLKAGVKKNIKIKSKDFNIIPTGIIIEIPQGFEAQVRPRSGLAANNGITVLNSPGTIDSDYRGEIKVVLINLGESEFLITPGMRIAQLVISPTYKANISFVKEILSNTKRGKKGFGSTGL
ncbi:MAG: deoxyuridine 5'-triphosphate nucleotidohydrolase [Alphaproteobacteria bacterium TMED62]|nr:MAG: deoxyuridine 5'-triphosphate nucleotidohydrolase [Alphaproteobacteria bacterium TMED62]|tara:strand:- start:215 stop:661 length:447 start_codon:yes stop_codon:yes gene_type:complete